MSTTTPLAAAVSAQPTPFLTEARVPDEGNAYRQQLEAEYQRHMEVPREQARRLQEVVLNLNDKMQGLLEKEKQEFLAAYRAHTRKIQEDLARLRVRVAEEEASSRKDEKLKQLSEERDHYRDEALRLDSHSALLKRELEQMKSKLEVLEDDRNFIVRQLKACRYKNQALRDELLFEETPESHDASRDGRENRRSRSDHDQGMHMTTEDLIGSLELSVSSSAHLPQLGSVGSTHGGGSHSEAVDILDRTQSDRLVVLRQREVRGLSRTLESEQRKVKTLGDQVEKLFRFRESNWLQACFVGHLRSTLETIEQRRREAELAALRSRTNLHEQTEDRAVGPVDHWDELPLRLEWFTPTDRCAVLKSLLKDPAVMEALRHKFQPPTAKHEPAPTGALPPVNPVRS